MANRSYNPTTRQENTVNGTNTAYRGCVSKSFQVTGILHIVAGALCIILGITAIVLKAFASYIAIPIWGGLLIFMTTGTIGLSNYCKPKSKNIVTAYLVMSTISAVFAFGNMIAFGIFIPSEDYWQRYVCHPLQSSFCESPTGSRILVDAILVLIFFLELVCGVIAASMACYKACQCCRRCCSLCTDDPGNSTMVYYAANVGGVPMMAVPNNQCSRPIYIAGGPSGTSNQPGQFMYLAPSPQPQSFVAVPAGPPHNQAVPQLPPPPQYNQPPSQQQQVQQPQPGGMSQQQNGPPTGQTSFVQIQASGQTQSEVLAQNQQAPQSQPAGMSGPPPVQAGFIQVQAPGQMQPQVPAQAQLVPQPQPMGVPPTGQVGFFQVQGPGGQIQMIPAASMYPQVMMAPAPQQPVTVQQPGPTQQPVHQTTTPSKPAEEPAEEEVSEPNNLPSGQVSSGHFSDQAALI